MDIVGVTAVNRVSLGPAFTELTVPWRRDRHLTRQWQHGVVRAGMEGLGASEETQPHLGSSRA